MVRKGRLELPRVAPLDPKSSASTNSATFAANGRHYSRDGVSGRTASPPEQSSQGSLDKPACAAIGYHRDMIGIFRGWRRRRILARRSIPEAIWKKTVSDIPAISVLDANALERLRALALVFLHEKSLEPAGGLELDDAMRTRIAALACRPLLGLSLDYYDNFLSVIVYPEEFLVRNRESVDEAGVVHTRDEILSGEAWDQGPVILAWQDVDASGRGDGYDVVAHECAHKLDLLEGDMNGGPPLNRGMRANEWTESFQTAYDDLIRRLDRGEEPWLDPYAAEEPAEFFAVCTEMFFDVPVAFFDEYPEIYAQLAAFFRQDPARSLDRIVRDRSSYSSSAR